MTLHFTEIEFTYWNTSKSRVHTVTHVPSGYKMTFEDEVINEVDAVAALEAGMAADQAQQQA